MSNFANTGIETEGFEIETDKFEDEKENLLNEVFLFERGLYYISVEECSRYILRLIILAAHLKTVQPRICPSHFETRWSYSVFTIIFLPVTEKGRSRNFDFCLIERFFNDEIFKDLYALGDLRNDRCLICGV